MSQNHVQHTKIGERTLSTNAAAAIVLSRHSYYETGTIEAAKNPAITNGAYEICCSDGPPSYHSGVTAPKAFGAGGKGIRTPGLLIANETLYQLSYTPVNLFRARD